MSSCAAVSKEPVDWRRNSLDAVRLMTAVTVMFFHVREHLQVPVPSALELFFGFFSGVPVFFSLSGFLIWDSIGRSNGFCGYLRKRARRIYPELWSGVLLGAVMLIIFADRPVPWSALALFCAAQGSFLQFWTPDALRSFGCGTPNGSLWTIGVTIQFYFAVYFFYKWMRGKKIRCWLSILACAVVVSVLSPYLQDVLPTVIFKLYGQTLVPYAWLFLLGAVSACYRDRLIPVLMKWWYVCLLISAGVMVTGIDIDSFGVGYSLVRCTALFWGLLGFAYRFPWFDVKKDISYGIFIYHMIVVNVMIELGWTQRFVYMLIAMVISCALAYFSARIFGTRTFGKMRKDLSPEGERIKWK